ncbi:MAG TPA: FAD-linked oxidase C-terminal domain-containing protein [Nevskiaceae bacterium]|nr:FAD-linked oxidase C-terminal domain-containing protein [Nevskiaceae bacterium]
MEQRVSETAVGTVVSRLAERYGERVSVNASIRDQHGHGEGYMQSFPPDVVVWPLDTREVSAIAALCNEHGVPLVAFGTGSSLEGHLAAVRGGVCVDLSRMDQVLALHAEDADCVVQPGLTRKRLNAYLRDTGLFFPTDPGADASIGGMISTRASGTTTIQYGTIADNVLALEVVLADGRVIRCGTRTRKSSAGYDLVHVFTGAEGTLGIITEATIRLRGRADKVGSGVCAFPELGGAVESVIELIQLGAPLARIEFLDEVQVAACNRYSKLTLPEKPTLFIEFNGSERGVTEQFEHASEVVRSHAGTAIEWAFDDARREALWEARHAAYFAARALKPEYDCFIGDVCVPISELVAAVSAARRDIDAAGLLATILGHVGDGNFHVLFLHDPHDAAQTAAVHRVNDAMLTRALKVGGTCTGEHGVGLVRRAKLREQFGDDTLDLMRRLKQAWDPNDILNPGKIFAPI